MQEYIQDTSVRAAMHTARHREYGAQSQSPAQVLTEPHRLALQTSKLYHFKLQ